MWLVRLVGVVAPYLHISDAVAHEGLPSFSSAVPIGFAWCCCPLGPPTRSINVGQALCLSESGRRSGADWDLAQRLLPGTRVV